MKRQLFSIATVLCLCTGCASHPPSDAQALASRINRAPGSHVTCGFGEVRYCQSDVDLEETCTCMDRQTLFGPRQPGTSH
jgi:hypothetical protein